MRVLIILSVIVGLIAGVIGDGEENCNKKHEECKSQAYATFKEAIIRGNDKRPDWMARKSCNYITDSIDKCGNMLVGCQTQAEVDQEKDKQLKDSLAQVEKHVSNWDSTKCPAIKAHEERVKAAAEAAAAAAAQQNAEPQPDPTGSATSLTVSVLSTLVLAMLV